MGVRYTDISSSNTLFPYSGKLPRVSNTFLVLATSAVAVVVVLNLLPGESEMCSRTQPSDSLEYRGVVDSMDRIGYDFKKTAAVTLDPRFESFYSLPKCNDLEWNPTVVIDIPRILATFQECLTEHIDSFKTNTTLIEYRWEKNVMACEEKLDLSQLKIEEFKNQHESKWAVLPRCQEDHVMVTFGVGHEVSAETKLNITVPNVKFFGADPIIEPNIQLYSAFGRFFPFAVGNDSGTDRFRVLPNQNQRTRQYVYQDVTTIEVIYVLQKIMKVNWIDFFWIDIEGGEMQFLDYFFKEGKFDQNRITICQFNVEFHPHYVENGAQKFYEFVDRIVKEGRYVFMKARQTGVGVTRLFFLNMDNALCVRKYFS